jgi:hypothetical protein
MGGASRGGGLLQRGSIDAGEIQASASSGRPSPGVHRRWRGPDGATALKAGSRLLDSRFLVLNSTLTKLDSTMR